MKVEMLFHFNACQVGHVQGVFLRLLLCLEHGQRRS